MKKIYLFICLLATLNSFSQEDAWVYFTDKPDAAYYLANPLQMLSQRALDRRINQNIALDATDVPIADTYIIQIENATGITVMAKSKWLNALHIRGTQTDIQALENLTFVSEVKFADHSLNNLVNTNPQTTATAKNTNNNTKFDVQINYNYGNSDNQINMLNGHLLHQQDYTGNGKIIAVLDSGFIGVDTANPFQHLQTNNLILGGYNFPDRNTSFYTRHNHGTMVLSTMGGYEDGQLVGTAPNASYYLFITEDVNAENPVEESYWVEAAEKADSLGVDIINSSLGYRTFDNSNYNYSYAQRNGQVGFASRGATKAFEKGIVCVISAGNDGNATMPYIGIPADAENILAVGAVNSIEAYASFSSIGNTADGRVKPDVCAQGVAATVSNTDGNIGLANGTSFASPILAGMVASFWEAVPSLTAAEVIQYVKESADQFASPDVYKGYGVPDFQTALTNALLTAKTENTTQIVVYPNPVSNYLLITNTPQKGIIYIYNNLGQKVLEKEILPQTTTQINTSYLASGIYNYTIQLNTTIIKGKISKR